MGSITIQKGNIGTDKAVITCTAKGFELPDNYYSSISGDADEGYQTRTHYAYTDIKYRWTCNGSFIGPFDPEIEVEIEGLDSGKENSMYIKMQCTCTLTIQGEIRYYNPSTEPGKPGSWGSWRNYGRPTVNNKTEIDSEKSQRLIIYTKPLPFFWIGNIKIDQIISINIAGNRGLLASDWNRLIDTAQAKQHWKDQSNIDNYDYSLGKAKMGELVTADKYNLVAKYCGCSTRVTTKDIIRAQYFINLSNSVNS